MKGFVCDVYRSAAISDCTRGGISAGHDTLILIREHTGNYATYEPSEERPGVELVVRWKGQPNEYRHVEPVNPPPEGHTSWVFGGNYLKVAHSISKYPLPIHDRCDTWADYEALSR